MNLGAFSISLAVKDLKASKAFYEKRSYGALKTEGVELAQEADKNGQGPSSFIVYRPGRQSDTEGPALLGSGT